MPSLRCRDRGFSLVELLIGVLIASALITASLAFSRAAIGRETMRSTAYDLQMHLQLARMEAAARNHPCVFLVSPKLGRVLVTDTMGTPSAADDEILHESRLPATVLFEAPDANPSITLATVGSWYATVFESDGTVSLGSGRVTLRGGDRFGQVAVFAAGASEIATWNGSGWSKEG